MKGDRFAKTLTGAVNCARGAPMGRPDIIGDRSAAYTFYLRKLPMVDGDYDQGGAYWGGGPTVPYLYGYFAENRDSDAPTIPALGYVRAYNRDEAKKAIGKRYPLATFYK